MKPNAERTQYNADMENIIGKDFRGCVLISQNGTTLFQKAQGYADMPNQIPNTVDTKFATASAGKVFVAVGILQLIERGLLCFDDTLENLLEFDLNRIDRKITIKQLLTHTSGIPDYFDESIMDEYEELWKDYPNYKVRTNRDLLPLFIDKPMMYPRGEKFQYNNTGYVVLAMIIEKIVGLPFDQFLKTNIFDACSMASTGYYELDRLPAKCASNYIFDEGCKGYRTNIYSVDAKGTGAGGAFTTVGDILRFWNNLLDYRLLSEKMTEEMLSRQSGNGTGLEDVAYGYGVWLAPSGTRYIPYFQGCDPGASFISEFEPQNNIVTTLVSNYGDNVWQIMRDIRKALYANRSL